MLEKQRCLSNIIETRGLSKTFNGRIVLDNIDLNIPRGSIFALIGPNGAGKTTLIRILLGLYKPTTGTFSIYTHNNDDNYNIRKDIGFMLHSPGLYPVLTSYENLALYARIYNIDNERERIEHLLELVGLTEYRDEQVHILSKGMRQKLVLARAILHDPELLILDEPTVGLEVETKIWFREFISNFVMNGDKTVLVSSHELSELEKICTDVAILRKGKIAGVYNKLDLNETSLEDLYLKSGERD